MTGTQKTDLSAGQLARVRELKPIARFGKGRGGFTPMPHAYFTILPLKCSGWVEHFTVGYICDRTFGAYDDKTDTNPEWCKLSLSVLARLTGMTTSAFWLALDDLVQAKLIERDGEGRGAKYRTTPELWINAADAERRAFTRVPKPPAEPAAPEPPRHSQPIEAGKVGKAVILNLSLAGVPDAVELKLRPANRTDLPLIFQTSVEPSGLITVTALNGEQKKAQPEQISSTPVHENSAFSLKSQRLDFLRTELKSLLSANWQKPLDEPFFARVSIALGPDAPVDGYAAFATTEIAAMRKARKTLTSGILEFLAIQHRRGWEHAAPQHAATAAAQAEADKGADILRDNNLRFAIDSMLRADPATLTDTEREWLAEHSARAAANGADA